MYLLDTNHCSRIINGDAAVVQRVAEVGETTVVTCVIVQGELMDMAHRSERTADNLPRFRAFLEDIDVYTLDEVIADVYGELKADLFARFGPRERSKRRRYTLDQLGVGENDLWIAATALNHNLIIVSADSDFVRLQEVRAFPLESWLPP